MSEENAKDPLNEAAGSTPFQPTEPLPSAQAWQSTPAPQFPPQGGQPTASFAPQGQSGVPQGQQYGAQPGYPQNDTYGQQAAFGHGQPYAQGQQYAPQPYGQGQPYGHGQQFGQPQQFQQYGPGQQYTPDQQFGAQQFPQGGYYDQQGRYVPPQYNSQSGQGGWNGGQPPRTSGDGVPIWAWILLLVAAAAIALGVLFLTGVFASSSDSAANSPATAAPSSDEPTIPAPTPVTTVPSPSALSTDSPSPNPTTASPGQKPTVKIQEGSAVVGNWKLEVSEYNTDATDMLASGFLPSTPSAGNKFIGVKFTFTNNGTGASDPFTDMFLTLMDESLTTSYREEWALDRDDTVVAMDEVAAGKSGPGWVFFEVPKDFTTGVLEIWDFSFDAEDVYLKIG